MWAIKNVTRAIKKNSQFSSNPYETWSNWLPHEIIISPSFMKIRQKLWILYQWAIFVVSRFFCSVLICKSEAKKPDTFKNWPLMKNPQFLSYPHETWWKWLPHEAIILTKFHKDWTKIVDFLLMAYFWTCADSFYSDLTPSSINFNDFLGQAKRHHPDSFKSP